MPLDPSIPLQARPFQMPERQDPMNMLAKVLQVQALADQSDANRLTMQEKQRGIERTNRMDEILRGGGGAAELRRAGFWEPAMKLDESAAKVENQKAQTGKYNADADKARLEQTREGVRLVGQIFGQIRDEASFQRARQYATSQGMPFPLQAYDPAAVAQIRDSALTREQQLEQEWKAKGYALEVRKADDANERHRKSLAQSEQHFKETSAAGKAPAGYRFKADGSLEFIPGGPADPNAARRAAPTEDERKAAGWLAQAMNGFDNMERALRDDPAANKPGLVESVPLVPEAMKNMTRSDARQRFNQGASSFAEAALRAATGAGVNESEARQKIAELTPQWGDKPPVIQQKRAGLKVYLDSLATRSGRAAPTPNSSGGATGSWGGGHGNVIDFGSLK